MAHSRGRSLRIRLSLCLAVFVALALAAGSFLEGGTLAAAGLVLLALAALVGVWSARSVDAPVEKLLQSVRLPGSPEAPGRPVADLDEIAGVVTGLRENLKQEA